MADVKFPSSAIAVLPNIFQAQNKLFKYASH